MLPNPLLALRNVATAPMRSPFEVDRFPQEQYTDPPGDPGLFGPDSVTWKVHAHPSMIVGGVSALMLQTLHPLAMAGVYDHSDFRERPLHRLSRTASFVVATTYGSTEVAQSVIDVVKRVHVHVKGTAPDGRPYSAQDPALLTWVHVAEMASFLRAHRRYHPNPVRGADLDRYFDETAEVAIRLGATDVPRSRAEVRQYLRDLRPELEAGEQAAEAMRFLLKPVRNDPVFVSAYLTIVRAAADLLPAWARQLHDLRHFGLVESSVIRPATFALLGVMNALGGRPPVVAEARERALAA